MNSTHKDQSVVSSGADDHSTPIARVEYQAPTLLRLDLACVIAGEAGSIFDTDFGTYRQVP